jgi:hypothetical protein
MNTGLPKLLHPGWAAEGQQDANLVCDFPQQLQLSSNSSCSGCGLVGVVLSAFYPVV